jgi:AcrR family transcriptional regulator
MARISKNPEDRRNEIIESALTLFLEKGYESTAVSDIVKRIGVAQGTFYYHFKSKSEILEAVVDRFISVIEKDLVAISERSEKNAVQNLNDALNHLIQISGSNKEFIEYIHQESNVAMHDRIVKTTMARLTPVLAEMVENGVLSGIFKVHYPLETTDVILSALFWQFHQPGLMDDEPRLERVKVTLEHFLDRMLGVSDHTFVLE